MAFPYRIRNKKYCFNPQSTERFRISRSKIDLFLECKRCFYLDQRLGLARVSFPPFTLNNAVDELLKKEFDEHRKKGTWHPVLRENGLRLKPFDHSMMDAWRDAMRRGVQYDLPETTLTIRGGVDDVWVDDENTLYVADYKATSKENDDDVNIDSEWQGMYKRQAEIYQWLLRKNGFEVSNTAYFYYVNARRDVERFSGKLSFNVKIIPYEGDDSWIEPTLSELYETLKTESVPERSQDCPYCGYVDAVSDVVHSGHDEGSQGKKRTKKTDSSESEPLF